MASLITRLALLARKKGMVPGGFLSLIRQDRRIMNARREWWLSQNPYRDHPPHSTYDAQYPVTLGIVPEFWGRHWPFISACRELGVAYRLVDISTPAWISTVRECSCDALLVIPSTQNSIWKRMYDDRLRMIREMGLLLYPTEEELWVYESKRRTQYWLAANDIPHPATWIFHDREEALDFCMTAELPIVAKTDMGSGSAGVRVFRDRKKLLAYAKKCFGRGTVQADGDARDAEWGVLLLQEFLPDVTEWRMIRVGMSYFGHKKVASGDFHSGSGLTVQERPPGRLLEFVKQVTDKGAFTSMNVDVFETVSGQFLVNELQTMFGWVRPYQMRIAGRPARFLWDPRTESFACEEGVFCQNGGCNLRVEAVLGRLGQKSKGWDTALDPDKVYE